MASPSAEHTALRILDVLRGGTGQRVPGSASIEWTLEQILDALLAGTVIVTPAGGGGGGGASLVQLSDATPQPVGLAGDPGTGTKASRDDHIHEGASGGGISTGGGSSEAGTPLTKDRRVTISSGIVPGSLPARQCNAVQWGRLSNVVFIGINAPASVNSVVAYPWTGAAFGTPVNGAAGNININGIARLPDDSAVLAASGTAPFVQALPWSGSAFSTAITPSPSVTGSGSANRVRVHPDGDWFALCRQHLGGTTPGVSVFAFDGAAIGAAADTIDISQNAADCWWSPDGDYLAVAWGASPFFAVYPFDKVTGQFGATLTPAADPAVSCEAVNWSDDGDFIFVAVNDANRLWAFPWDVATETLGTPVKTTGSSIPTGVPNDIAVSADRAFIAVSFTGTPFAQLIPFVFDGSAYGTPQSLPSAGGPVFAADVDISPDGAFCAIGMDGTTRLVAATLTRAIGA